MLDLILPSYLPKSPENQNITKVKHVAGDIIILQ